MKRTLSVLAAVAAIGLSATAAVAADLDYTPPPEEPLPAARGWYLRGDVGYTFDTSGDGEYWIYDDEFAGPNKIHYDRFDLRWNHDVSVGVGYRFNDHLRGDITVGHWGRDVDGRAYYNGINSWTYDDSSSMDVWEMLVNAYLDIGRYGRFTPYIGAGAGVAFVDYGRLTNDATCACGGSFTGYHDGLSSTRATWALMAGTAIDITESFKVDVGYRFSRIEGGRAFGFDQFDTANGLTGTQTWDNGFNSHQIRVGLRKEFF
jgi:opacity protein-like surface antigen